MSTAWFVGCHFDINVVIITRFILYKYEYFYMNIKIISPNEEATVSDFWRNTIFLSDFSWFSTVIPKMESQ
jgi:hypothetical protein